MAEEKTIEQLTAELAAAIEENAKKDLLIESLSKKIEKGGVAVKTAAKTAGAPTDIIKVGEKNYQFKVASFGVPGHGLFKAADVLENDEVIAAIIAIEGQQILAEVFE